MSNLDGRKRQSVLRLSPILGFCFSLAAQSSISEAQSPAELRLHVEPGWNALPVIETPSDPDTPLRSSMSIQDSRQRELSIPDIKSTLFSQTSEPQLMVGDGAFENQTVHWVFASQAQDLTLPIPQETVEKNTEQTRTSSSTVAEGWHAVHFIKTHIYDDPQVDRVLRWDPSAKAYKDLSVGDRLEPTVMYWLYRSAPGMLSFSVLGGTARTPQPLTTASEVESQKTPRSLVEGAPVIGLGDFETPSVATKNDVHAAMPKSVVTGHGEKTMVHLAYIAKDEQGDHIEVLHSLKSGKAGSFRRDQGRRVATALPGWTITELAVAASSEKLVIAWIEKGSEEDKTLMRIQKKQLMFTGAQEPTPSIVQAPPGVGEADPSWKRTLSLAIDPDGHVHMTWNQANQVLYAYDFEIERTPDGRPLNVFNQHVRTPATEIVKYKAQYAPRANGRCDCEDCWCDESYPISEEPDPKKDGQPRGPYIDRTHEAYAYAPSLHIGPKSVMIIAKQLRLWEDHPVPSEAWQRMHAEPIYSTTIVQRAQPTKWVQGWRQTWKTAYEPGDEHRWAGLGFQYQYLYQGTWHEADQIVFAHRSLDREDTKSPAKKEHSAHHPVAPWNLSVVDGDFAPQASQKPSYPKVAHMPSGSLIAVYEKGPQHDANQADGNPLFYATSDDGQVWASPKNLLAEGEPLAGYLPQVAISGRGEIGVAYYRPSLSTDLGISGRVQIARSRDQGRTWNVDTLNEERRTERLLDVAPLHGTTLDTETTTKAAYSDHYAGEPNLTADGDLFFAAFVHQAKEAHKRNRILTTRASRDQSVRQLDATVEHPSSATSAPPTVKVALVNKHHVKVYDAPPEELVAAVEASLEASPQAPLWASNPGAPAGAHAALTASPPLMQVELVEGEAVVSWAPADPPHTDEAVPPNPSLNYTKAIAERESLIRRTTLQASEGGRYDYADFHPPLSKEGAYQVEYRPANHRFGDDQVPFDPRAASLYEGDDPDSIHLAGFERVWVYTLGIALAQLSRTKTVPGLTIPEHRARTQAMARYLCGHAVVDQANPHELKGWHFSWNTTGDSFKDPRLVTGANAWAIHGLGVFITSEAFENLPQDEEQAWFRQCYQSALLGLQRHRRTFEVGHQARQVSLMTAGWSTRGLEAVDRPFPIQGDGEPSPIEAHHERWAYYSVVDAIGYDVYDEAQPPVLKACTHSSLCSAADIPEDAWQAFTLSERAWARLKQPEIARNVVTEHNLDVLSVLNHALNHTGALGLSNKGALEAWRNEVRDGIFYALWDQVPPSTLAYLAEREPHKQAWLKDEASTDAKSPMGRIVTGGAFQEDGTFLKSSHTAIDNCSWLALSVDYRDLPPSDEGPSIYVSRLERCLQYTILRFAKKMGFSDSGPKYYGTHYFQNAFRDPYINPSDLQESSYHLEATMGLILGLHRFVGAHPEVQSREGLEYEAERLWANAQAFTRDHGFPYSSQRIQDLSTLLSSSTAILWFIDVHDALETPPSLPPGALAMGQSFFGAASFLGGLETSLALGPRPEAAARWVYGVEVIKQLGAREALKLVLAEILATGVFTAITGEIHQEEINDLVDQLLVNENHNVVVVEEHVPFEVPAGYDYVGRAPPLEPSNPKDYYTSVRDMVSAYPSYWEEAFSDSIMANLGFGVGNTTEEQEEAAQALRAMVQGAIPQDVILQKTWDGIEVYRKLRLFQPLDRLYQAPRGVVLHLSPDHEGPKLIHHQPGSWTNWYEGEIAASDIPEAYKDTYIQWIHQWLLDIVLGVPSCKQRHSSDAFGVTAPSRCPTIPPGWDHWRTEATKDIAKGGLLTRHPSAKTPEETATDADSASVIPGGPPPKRPALDLGGSFGAPQELTLNRLRRIGGRMYIDSPLLPESPNAERVFSDKVRDAWHQVYGPDARFDVHGLDTTGGENSNLLSNIGFATNLFVHNYDKLFSGHVLGRKTIEEKLARPPSLAQATVTGPATNPQIWVEYRNEWDIPVIPAANYGAYQITGENSPRFTRRSGSTFTTVSKLENQYGLDLRARADDIVADSAFQFGTLLKPTMFVPMGLLDNEVYLQPFLTPIHQNPDQTRRWKDTTVELSQVKNLPAKAIRDTKYLDLEWYIDNFTPPTGGLHDLYAISGEATTAPTGYFSNKVKDGKNKLFLGNYVGQGRVVLHMFTPPAGQTITFEEDETETRVDETKSVKLTAAMVRTFQAQAFKINYKKPTPAQVPVFFGLPTDPSGALTEDVYQALVNKIWALVKEKKIGDDGNPYDIESKPKADTTLQENAFTLAFGPALTMGTPDYELGYGGLLNLRIREDANGEPEIRFTMNTDHPIPFYKIVPHTEVSETTSVPFFRYDWRGKVAADIPNTSLQGVLDGLGSPLDSRTDTIRNKLEDIFGESFHVRISIVNRPTEPEVSYGLQPKHDLRWKRERIDPLTVGVPLKHIRSDGTVDLAYWLETSDTDRVAFASNEEPTFATELVSLEHARPDGVLGSVELVYYHDTANPDHESYQELVLQGYSEEASSLRLRDRPSDEALQVVDDHIQVMLDALAAKFDRATHLDDVMPYHGSRHTEEVVNFAVFLLRIIKKTDPLFVSEWIIRMGILAGLYHDFDQSYKFGKQGERIRLTGTNEQKSANAAAEWMDSVNKQRPEPIFSDEDIAMVEYAILATQPSFRGGEFRHRLLDEENVPLIARILTLADVDLGAHKPNPWLTKRTNEAFREKNLDVLHAIAEATAPLPNETLAPYKRRVIAYYNVVLDRVRARQEQSPIDISYLPEGSQKTIADLFDFDRTYADLEAARDTLDSHTPREVLRMIGYAGPGL